MKIQNVYQAADVFVMPSICEPFGIVMIEAMAQGLPIIATNNGGPIDVIKQSFGRLVNPTDQKKIASYIEKITANPNYSKMSEAAYKEARKYVWDKILNKYLKVYEQVA